MSRVMLFGPDDNDRRRPNSESEGDLPPDTWWSRTVPTMLVIVVIVTALSVLAMTVISSRFNDTPLHDKGTVKEMQHGKED